MTLHDRRLGPAHVVTVDLDAIAENTRSIAEKVPGALMAVVKADGFGHGASDVARTALTHGATWLGTTTIDEALALRAEGFTVPVLSWLNHMGADFEAAIEHDIDIAVPSIAHFDAVARAAARRGKRARVHLHVDSGMARDGAEPAAWRALCRAAYAAQRQGWLNVVGVMSHMACAADPDDRANLAARTRFAGAVALARTAGLRPAHRHLAATAAALSDPASHHTMVRVGAGLVGIDPTGRHTLTPAMTITSELVSVRTVPAGTPVGYDHVWATTRPTRLGLVAMGYADGIPRRLVHQAHVDVAGQQCPVVGKISMDQMVVDLGALDVGPGEPVTVLGRGAAGSARDWARWADTIEHDIVTGFHIRGAARVTASASAHVRGI